MNFYEIAIIGIKSPPFIYKSQEKIEIGDVVKVTLKSKSNLGVVLKEVEKPNFECLELEKTKFYFPKEYLEIAIFMATYYFCSIGEALAIFEPFNREQKLLKAPKIDNKTELSHVQNEALNFVFNNQVSLIFGDTGSGKTEIYIKAIQKMIENGKNCIYLMPEIALTPQIEKRLRNVFGTCVAIWHSKISKNKKQKILKAIYDGKIRIIAGARSALFLPLKDLGIIIVDEEHDDSYKSQFDPKYNARDIAIYMAKKLNCRVVLGSATPSATSFYKYPYFRLKGKFFDSKNEIFFEKEICALSSFVLNEIKKRLEKNEQIIVFLPTRANFKYQICLNCYKSIECPFCSISLSVHISKNLLKCHYCGYTQSIVKRCPNCGNSEFFLQREGTSEIVKLLQNAFLDAKVEKFDRDEITSEKALKERLEAFNKKEIDILVGTHMISKGHDYHNVTLVVVMGIDYVLYQSDFRAREKAISLLFQIIGRSGRRYDGIVIIQTLNQEFFMRYLNDYEIFLKEELKLRKAKYPPFARLAIIRVSNKNQQKAIEITEKIVNILKNSTLELIGYGQAPIPKLGGKFRFNILVRTNDIKKFGILHKILDDYECDIDIDPINFL